MNIVIFEDPLYKNFDPISVSHPVFDLLCGTSKMFEKWIKSLRPRSYSFLCRPVLADVLAEAGYKVNTLPNDDTIFINGRFIPGEESLRAIKKLAIGESLIVDGDLMAFRPAANFVGTSDDDILNLFDDDSYKSIRNRFKEKKSAGIGFKYLWEMIDRNGEIIENEYSGFSKQVKKSGKVDPKASLIRKSSITIISGAKIGPQVCIDASDGPVIISHGTNIEPLTYVQGPVYIGPNCRIVGGKIREGCSLGPTCRVGGEVEESILLGYDNKYHEGFLGHAYLGEWVNLGAMTTNSDLKNNYSSIAVMVNDQPINSGKIKVGCFIGDHTKTGIGTTLNTGINIGFSCNLYGGSLFIDRQIRSFSWGTPGNLVEYRLDKALETASNSMKRRDMELTMAYRAVFEYIYSTVRRIRIPEANKHR